MQTKRLGRRIRARLVLAACLGLFVAGIVAERTAAARSQAEPSLAGSSRDIDLHAAVIARIRDGEPYYQAVGTELRQRHYATASVFNWRTPLLYTSLAAVPPSVGRGLLAALAVVLLVMTLVVLSYRPIAALFAGFIVEIGAVVALLVPAAAFIHEAWAGALIGISICAYQRGRWRAAAATGLLALFVRELVAPYALLCGVLALRRRRWHEFSIWAVGAVAYAAYYAWHFQHVTASQHPGDIAQAHSWVYAGGLPFVLATLRTNALLLVAPRWVASAMLAVLVAACARRESSPYVTGSVLLYVGLFLFVGLPFNFYWGLLLAPLYGFAVADGFEAVPRFISAAR